MTPMNTDQKLTDKQIELAEPSPPAATVPSISIHPCPVDGEVSSPSKPTSELSCPIPGTKNKIDRDQVRRYARMGVSLQSIAVMIGCSVNRFRRSRMKEYQLGRAERELDLRVWQYSLAKAKNGAMLIWLGRNELGQSNSPEIDGEPEPQLDPKMG